MTFGSFNYSFFLKPICFHVNEHIIQKENMAIAKQSSNTLLNMKTIMIKNK